MGKNVWGHDNVRDWYEVAREAQRAGKKLHMGRLFGLCVEKGSELPEGDERMKIKYRVVFGGDNAIDQSWGGGCVPYFRIKPSIYECR